MEEWVSVIYNIVTVLFYLFYLGLKINTVDTNFQALYS